MWRHSITIGAAVAVIALGTTASPVEAEPITVHYSVDIFQQCSVADSTQTCRAFRQSFPMTLTFDTTVVNEHSEPGRVTKFYGEPTLSDIPLQLSDFPPLTPPRRTASETARFSAEDGTWIRESLLDIHQNASIDGNDFHRDLQITASGAFAALPDLDAASFAQFLGTAPFHQFFMADSIELASGGFVLLGYFGQASLALDPDPAVTPEPASMLLLATGITGLAWRRRRSAAA